MFKVLQLNDIDNDGLKLLDEAKFTYSKEIDSPDAILLRSHNLLNFDIPDSVKVIVRAGTGVNNIPTPRLTEKGVVVMNTPGANANAVKELVLAGLLIANRNICQASAYVNSLDLKGSELDSHVEKVKKQYAGSELSGKTLGVIGLGNVGLLVANAAIDLGMKVIAYDPFLSKDNLAKISSKVTIVGNIQAILPASDFITLHVPFFESTKNLIDAGEIKSMKDGAVILNFSRSGIINDSAILDALNQKKLKSYVTDFPSEEFRGNPKIIALPHLGGSTGEAERNCATMAANQLVNFLNFGIIDNSVNFPTVGFYANQHYRILITNKNIPSMVSQITTYLSSENFNIDELINKSRDDVAYTVIETDHQPTETLLKKLSEIEGVLRVRSLYLGE
jgi:D-3-phosphoglycerate dehydrogenase